MFNAMNRFGEAKMMAKLWDLRQHPEPPAPKVPHPAIDRLIALYRKLIEATEGMTQDGLTIRWPAHAVEKVYALKDEWQAVLVETEAIFDAHFEDRRHSSGEMNRLYPSRGSKHNLWGARSDAGYDHYVRPTETGETGHVRHSVCGASYELAEHFRAHLRHDPTFYGVFRCDACRMDVPWAQMEILNVDPPQ